MDRKLETKVVKAALVKAGFTGCTVTHGTGSSYGSLYIHAEQGQEPWAWISHGIAQVVKEVLGPETALLIMRKN